MRSSILTTQYCIVLFLVCAAAALVARMTFIAAFLILIAIICIISRRWALTSLQEVEFEADCSKHRFFPDETFALEMTVANNKYVPLVWLDVAVPLEDGCPIMPVDENDIYEEDGLTRADEELPRCKMLRKRFAFLMPWQKLQLSEEMRAVHRGIYKFDKLRIYSGDGFGLTQTGLSVSDEERVFAVYPKMRQINADLFLRTQWMSTGRSKGFMEEPTLIRGMRDYQPTDSWKRINWRMAARGQDLQVNLPEMILPQSSHFILDGESFSGERAGNAVTSKEETAGNAQTPDGVKKSQSVDDRIGIADDEGFELMLSLMCSIIIRLNDAGLACGLTLPDSLRHNSITYGVGTSIGELLFALAAYERKELVKLEDAEEEQADAKEQRENTAAENADNIERKKTKKQETKSAYVKPFSRYDRTALLAAAENAGTIYYLTKNIRSSNLGLIKRLGTNNKVIMMPIDEPDSNELAQAPCRVIPLKSIIK